MAHPIFSSLFAGQKFQAKLFQTQKLNLGTGTFAQQKQTLHIHLVDPRIAYKLLSDKPKT